MIELNGILVPTDFREHSAEASRFACGLAEKFAAEIHGCNRAALS